MNENRRRAVRALVHKTAMSLPPSDFGSHRAIEAMTDAFLKWLDERPGDAASACPSESFLQFSLNQSPPKSNQSEG